MKLLADLHVHSCASADGRSSVEALIEAAKARGLAAITVSDHDLCTPLPESPDVLLIPGVEITSCAPGGGYTARSGTSMATPFVTGSAALLMEWGIVRGNDAYLYGEKIKAYLIRGARPLGGGRVSGLLQEYPNPQVGWGTLCLSDSLPE